MPCSPRSAPTPCLLATGEEEELVELVRDADAILTCFAHVTARVVAAGERLRVIGRYGVGTDNIAVDEAARRGIPVTNVPVYCTDEVAEHVLALRSRLRAAWSAMTVLSGWATGRLATGLPIHRIAGSTIGIVGFGAIGQALSHKARGLGMQVLVHDPGHPERARLAGAEPVPLIELARRSDFVSLHVPLRDSTRSLVGADFLAAMKPTAYLLNAARGGIVDHVALAAALQRGMIAGAGLDVFEPERIPPDDPLLAHERLIATPHVAFYSEESIADLARLAAENVAAVLAGRPPAAVVAPDR